MYARTARLSPIPQLTGPEGYILHYETVLKVPVTENTADNLPYIDGWFKYLTFALAADLAPEFGVGITDKVYLDKKASFTRSGYFKFFGLIFRDKKSWNIR
jgi:hypothetical protein